MFINDVGESAWEEINDGIAGSNYGWPVSRVQRARRGSVDRCSPMVMAMRRLTDARYRRSVLQPVVAQFPASYVGSDFADLCGDAIHRINPASGYAFSTFCVRDRLPVDLQVGPDGNLYYLARGGGGV